jgi:hypothetical protein
LNHLLNLFSFHVRLIQNGATTKISGISKIF